MLLKVFNFIVTEFHSAGKRFHFPGSQKKPKEQYLLSTTNHSKALMLLSMPQLCLNVFHINITNKERGHAAMLPEYKGKMPCTPQGFPAYLNLRWSIMSSDFFTA